MQSIVTTCLKTKKEKFLSFHKTKNGYNYKKIKCLFFYKITHHGNKKLQKSQIEKIDFLVSIYGDFKTDFQANKWFFVSGDFLPDGNYPEIICSIKSRAGHCIYPLEKPIPVNHVALLGTVRKTFFINEKRNVCKVPLRLFYKNNNNLYIDVKAFGKAAQTLEQNLERGSKIAVTGSLLVNSFTDKQGSNRNKLEISLISFSLTEREDIYQNNKQIKTKNIKQVNEFNQEDSYIKIKYQCGHTEDFEISVLSEDLKKKRYIPKKCDYCEEEDLPSEILYEEPFDEQVNDVENIQPTLETIEWIDNGIFDEY